MNERNYLTETIRTMQTHSSVRKYTSDPIPEHHLMEILRAAQGAASSGFVQAYSVVRVTDSSKKEQIATLSNNPQVQTCAEFLLFCGDFKRLEYTARKLGFELEHDNLENFIVAVVDTALVAQNTITAAESLGYGGCYIGGVRNNPGPIGDLVGLPDKVFPLFGLCLGVPAQRNELKPRLPLEAILHENVYDEAKYPETIDRYDETMREYYQKRTSNTKISSWSESIAGYLKKRREHMREFMESKGFRLP